MFRRFLRPSFALCSEFRRGDNQAVGYSILFPEACDSGAKDRSLFVHVSTSLLPFTFCPSHKCGHVGTISRRNSALARVRTHTQAKHQRPPWRTNSKNSSRLFLARCIFYANANSFQDFFVYYFNSVLLLCCNPYLHSCVALDNICFLVRTANPRDRGIHSHMDAQCNLRWDLFHIDVAAMAYATLS